MHGRIFAVASGENQRERSGFDKVLFGHLFRRNLLMDNETVSKNFIEQIIDKDIEEGHCQKVVTRFPPEPKS